MVYRALAALLLLALLVTASLFWLRKELATPYFEGTYPEIFVDIPRGASSRHIASLLAESGVLRDQIPFLLYLKWKGNSRHLQAGEYRFSEPATPVQVIDRLIRGDVYYISVTIPEGLTAKETVEVVANAGLGNIEALNQALVRTDWIRDLDPGAKTLEGYMFPSTYHFSRREDSDQIVKTMVEKFHDEIKRVLKEKPLRPGKGMPQIVTLASLVEKEASIPEERLLVASVLSNRLERKIPLACDPTIIYALKLAGRYDGNIRKRDLLVESPYNTYVNLGLPPGPIANPGEDSLRAALDPPRTDLLYFVSRNDGTHQFSKDFRSHQNAVARYQKRFSRSGR